MRRRHSPPDILGVEAGIYMPAHVLGDGPPPPRRLRRAAVIAIAGVVGSGVVAVNTVPAVGDTWRVVSHQTDKVLGHVLGKAELHTAQVLSGSSAEGTETTNPPAPLH